ncbi:hypothetical protein QR680_011484 [Steinernema hermaphroditum]|uniref:Uncharacterized protein n=1 Tax=Steinernema hermaphroditum TaxID=289476 RepID=A0AA39I081_9BILA|nr:hypothetical protein QR680_011484 [Steinernema hermaphroditum]
MDGDMTKERFQEEVKKMVDELKVSHAYRKSGAPSALRTTRSTSFSSGM